MELKKIDHVTKLHHNKEYLCKLGRWWAILWWDSVDGRFTFEEDDYYCFADCKEYFTYEKKHQKRHE